MHQPTKPKHKLQNSPRNSPARQRPYFSFSWQIFTFLRLEILQIFDTFRPEPSGVRLILFPDGATHLLPLLLLFLLSGPDLLPPPARLPPASGRHWGSLLLQLLLPPLLPTLPPPTRVVTRAAPRVFTRVLRCVIPL